MTISKNEDFFGDILDWEYPKRHTSKSDDYISFKAKDPVTGKLRQKKYSLMQYPKGIERDMMAGQMTANLLRRLQGGWNPFVPDVENRSGTLFTEVTAEYRKTLTSSSFVASVERMPTQRVPDRPISLNIGARASKPPFSCIDRRKVSRASLASVFRSSENFFTS